MTCTVEAHKIIITYWMHNFSCVYIFQQVTLE